MAFIEKQIANRGGIDKLPDEALAAMKKVAEQMSKLEGELIAGRDGARPLLKNQREPRATGAFVYLS